MQRSLGTLIICYGAFLLAAGVVGYVATRETSTSALLNGGVFGSLMIVLGILFRHGRMWTYPSAMSATAIFTLTFAWRGAVQWQQVTLDDQLQLSVALLLTIMFIASAIVLRILFKHYKH